MSWNIGTLFSMTKPDSQNVFLLTDSRPGPEIIHLKLALSMFRIKKVLDIFEKMVDFLG